MGCENALELTAAQKRILDLEVLVASLYDKIKVLESKNSALQDSLHNLEKQSAKENPKASHVNEDKLELDAAQESSTTASSIEHAADILSELREDQTTSQIEQVQTTDQFVSFASELFLTTTRKEKDHGEIDYVGVLNRALPPDIRILGWCHVPYNFHARFSCLSREYNYFFINDGLDIEAMKFAAGKFCGEHDFRNFCKMDADNVHNFQREIFSFDILPLLNRLDGFELWMFQVKGTAFLWHQVRCMVAVLLMIGQKKESPSVVDDLLNIQKTARKPQYVMAPESSLVLQSCEFQGLSFFCLPGSARFLHSHFKNMMNEYLVVVAMLKQLNYHLPNWDDLGHSKDLTCRKSSHVPLLFRPTEPTYAERRTKLLNKKQETPSSLSLLS